MAAANATARLLVTRNLPGVGVSSSQPRHDETAKTAANRKADPAESTHVILRNPRSRSIQVSSRFILILAFIRQSA